jgi:hypothetical protein
MKQGPSKQYEDCFSWHEAPFLCLSSLNGPEAEGSQESGRKEERPSAGSSGDHASMAYRWDRMGDGSQNLHLRWASAPNGHTGREVDASKDDSTYGC